jgi:16S rRNA (guanine527-N7)-methyltransferase
VATVSSLQADSGRLGVALDADAVEKLFVLAAELAEWNQKFNLTSIADELTVTHHLLDSLSLAPHLKGRRVVDVGTGAGFPGLPLAIACPAHEYVLIDATRKKLGFVDHMVARLGLQNVSTVHTRAESYKPSQLFDSVMARAVAKIDRFIHYAERLCAPGGRILAMKGRIDETELRSVPRGWQTVAIHRIEVPGLEAERHIVELTRVQSVRGNPV